MKHFILAITFLLMMSGIYQIEFNHIESDLDRLGASIGVYISYSTLCLIVALGDK